MKPWEDFLKQLEGEIGKPAVDRWLRPFQVVDFDAGNLYLKAQDAFQALWFERQIRKIAKERFLNEAKRPIKIHIDAFDLPKQEKKTVEQPPAPTYTSTPLDPECTLDSFVATDQNALLVQFLKTLKPGADNPLLLFGGAGVGKTHLLMALAAQFAAQGLKTFYTHAQTFTDHVVSAIRSSNVEPLRKTYRHVDVLLIDDIHCLARKGATQEEFFHTFNSLHARGCQIILSSQLAPSRMTEIEPRLISRFEWGIQFEIQPAAPELFGQILKKRAEILQLPLSTEIVLELLKTFKSGTKSALRALDALALRLPKKTQTVSLPQIHTLLADLIAQEQTLALTPERIVQNVAHYFGMPSDDLLGKSQIKEIVLPRQIAVFLLRTELKMPYLAIGRLFSRDHSTIMASVRLIEKKKGAEAEIARALFEIKEKL